MLLYARLCRGGASFVVIDVLLAICFGTACRGRWMRCEQGPGRRRPRAFGWEGEETTGGLRRSGRRRSHAAFSNHTRPVSWLGRKPLAHIRAQREPVVSPAGAGTEYRRPQAVS
jgi:hypothetical protein